MKISYKFLYVLGVLITAIISFAFVVNQSKVKKKKYNVLFIAIDDLRPELGAYGASHIHSPNIDALSSDGVLFSSAYTQQAVCAPSRNTLMTGLRPDGLGITNLATFFREKAPNAVTLPQYFKQNGYRVEGMGKIYHTAHGNSDDSLSWSNKHFTSNKIIKRRKALRSGDTTGLQTSKPRIDGKRIPYYKVKENSNNILNDQLVVEHALERLEILKDSSFFMAVGIAKPHLPFVVPEKYWDMYNPESIKIPSTEKPEGHPKFGFSGWGELRKYHGIPKKGRVTNEQAVNLIHGYYASVSYADDLVGKLTKKLKDLGLYENTIIVLWGDHGFKLGDYGDWCKHTNYEIDTRIPLIIKQAGNPVEQNRTSSALVETVDIYPTLCDLAQLEKPEALQGDSFAEALYNSEFDWDDVAISQYPRKAKIDGEKVNLMGYAMRTKKYRFVKWVNIKTNEIVDIEVYEHKNNNQKLEMKNIGRDFKSKELIASLSKKFIQEYDKEHKLH